MVQGRDPDRLDQGRQWLFWRGMCWKRYLESLMYWICCVPGEREYNSDHRFLSWVLDKGHSLK